MGRTMAVITGAVPTETGGVGTAVPGVRAEGMAPGCVGTKGPGGWPLIAVIKRRACGPRDWSNSDKIALFGKARLLSALNVPTGVWMPKAPGAPAEMTVP